MYLPGLHSLVDLTLKPPIPPNPPPRHLEASIQRRAFRGAPAPPSYGGGLFARGLTTTAAASSLGRPGDYDEEDEEEDDDAVDVLARDSFTLEGLRRRGDYEEMAYDSELDGSGDD